MQESNTLNDELARTETEIRHQMERYIETGPYELNPDSKKVDKVIKSLAKRKLKDGHQYCPCRMLSGNDEIDSKIVCPCEYHVEEIEKDDICSCDFFVSPNYKSISSQIQ